MKDKISFNKNSLEALEIPYKELEKFSKRINFNYLLSDYYLLIDEAQRKKGLYVDSDLIRKADRIKNCATVWNLDYYRLHGIKDILKINLCGSKFCFNCQSAKASERFKRFEPVINYCVKEGYIPYHVTFTVPNPSASELDSMLNKMYKAFLYLNRYLTGRAKIRDYDFDNIYGYFGAVKSLEITYNVTAKNYHPHFHCLFLLKRRITSEANIINKFSYNRKGELTRKFTAEEILLQKIWYLLINGMKVNRKNIEALDCGYTSVMNTFNGEKYIDDAESTKIAETNSYREVFKYTLKGNYKDGQFLTPETLQLYEDVLRRRRMIQGHGIFYDFDFESAGLEDVKNDVTYMKFKAKLREIEKPVECIESINDVMLNHKNDKNVKYISRKNVSKVIDLKEFDN